jgi:predicted nucleic-acid-binding Zn-ribbon protein
MQKPKCPKCGSEDLEDDMITIYGIWGELVDTEQVKKYKRCREVIREGEKHEDKSI